MSRAHTRAKDPLNHVNQDKMRWKKNDKNKQKQTELKYN